MFSSYWPERYRLRNTIVLNRCCVSYRRVPRYTIIFYVNIWPKYCLGKRSETTPQNIKYERYGYFFIVGKLIIFQDFLLRKYFEIPNGLRDIGAQRSHIFLTYIVVQCVILQIVLEFYF